MRFNPLFAGILVVLVALGGPAGSVRTLSAQQSLADLSRQEEARRKGVKDPAKVITNKDLGDVPSPSASGTASAKPADAKSADAKAGEGDKDAEKDKPKEPVKDQKYWVDRNKELQLQLDRDTSFSNALQVQINSLATDFANRDDPIQRALIDESRQKAVGELARLKDAIAKDKKALDDLYVEARRAGVPPGWLR